MNWDAVLVIFFRWLHVATACVAVGGVFFTRIVLPIGLKVIEAQPARDVLLRTRRVFKMVVHSSILLLVVSGTFNAVRNWPSYKALGPGVGHGLFGVHVLLALGIFAIALWLLAGPDLRVNHRKWMAINLVLMFLTIAAASTLKYFREHAATKSGLNPTPVLRYSEEPDPDIGKSGSSEYLRTGV